MCTLTSFAPKLPADVGDVLLAPAAAARAVPVRRLLALAVPAGYLAAAMLLTWRLWADPASRMVARNTYDGDLFAWFMRYAASAAGHGHWPALVTTGMNAPGGVNLMWNTPLLLAGLLLAPITGLFGPQVSLTILTTIGFAGSALALYWVLRRWGISRAAAVLAGAVFGFSPALLQEAQSHYNLQLVLLPPLIVDAGIRLVTGRLAEGPAWRWLTGRRPLAWLLRVPPPLRTGAWLGVLGTGQIFLSEEIALSTALTGVVLVLVLALSRPRAIAGRALPVLAGLLTATGVTLALAGHALTVEFYGPLVQHGPVYPLDHYINDLTGFVTPQAGLIFHTAASAAAAASYQGGETEYLAYLGWPLLILLVPAAVLACWRPLGRAVLAGFVALVVCSLGGYLLLSGQEHQGIELPWHWIEKLPVISTALPDRFSILADGLAAVLLAIGIDEAAARLRRRAERRAGAGDHEPADGVPTGVPARVPAGGRRWRAVVLGVAVLGCLPLIPAPVQAASTYPLPAGWDGVFAALRLAPGTRVLLVPVPLNFLTPALRWQAESGEPAAMIGGYYIGPGASNGQPYVDGYGTKPTAWYLNQLWAAGLSPASPYATAATQAGLGIGTATAPGKLPAALAATQLQADLAGWQPGAVVADAAPGSPLVSYLDSVFGRYTVTFDGVTGWRLTGGR